MKLKKDETVILLTAKEKETIGRALYNDMMELSRLQALEDSSERRQTIETAKDLLQQLGYSELVKLAMNRLKEEQEEERSRKLKAAGLL